MYCLNYIIVYIIFNSLYTTSSDQFIKDYIPKDYKISDMYKTFCL